MPIEWGEPWERWKTPERILDDWRRRLARLAEEEVAYFSDLPYVKGTALIGTLARGTAWPLSDVDILTVVDAEAAQDAADLIRAAEQQRNQALSRARIPNEVEARYWVLEADDLVAANRSEDGFFDLLRRPHRWGIVFKACGGRPVKDFGGQVRQFIDTCDRTTFGDRFVRFRLDARISHIRGNLDAAEALLKQGDWAAVSARALVAAHDMTTELYLIWRKLAESITRSVTRLVSAARDAGEPAIATQFLTAAGLDQAETRRRFAAAPSWATRQRDVVLAVRRTIGEQVDELGGTRDLLHVSSYLALRHARSGPYPAWVSATNTRQAATARLQAAERLLNHLRSAQTRLAEYCPT
jgi:predicted nucleotidyltransferase